MSCTDPIRQCLYEHIRPKLASAKVDKGGRTIRARCPVCGDPRSLTVSAGQHNRAVWNCYAGCCQPELRAAFITAGVPAACLPVSKAADKALGEVIAAVCQQGTKADRGQTLLRAYLIALGHRRWPQGAELRKLAAEVQVSKTDAYRAKSAGPLLTSPGTPSTYGGV